MHNDSEVFAVVGGGFGLYGYLPALIRIFGGRIVLHDKYRNVINSREELIQFNEFIEWQPSIEDLLQKATGLVIAIPPSAQFELVKKIAGLVNIKKLVLEKPLAPCPNSSAELVEVVLSQSKKLRVGYTFVYTTWYPLLKALMVQTTGELRIIWKFKANHISIQKETWKRYHSLGGGVVRFYGIHLISVLALLGFTNVIFSNLHQECNDQPTVWNAEFAGQVVPKCEILVSIESDDDLFVIESTDKAGNQMVYYSETTPFDSKTSSTNQDVRVPVLEKILRSFDDDDLGYANHYSLTNDLWRKVEDCSVFRL